MVASRFFTPDDRRAIADAVAAAEQQTAGEVVPVLATSSDDYHRAEDLIGLGTAFVALATTWTLFQRLLPPADWDGPYELAIQLPVILIILVAGFAIGALLATRLPWLKRLAVSRRTMTTRVMIAAHHAFDALHVRRTAGATGIVIYVSLFERQVCVWADQAISTVIPASEWHGTCEILTKALRQGHARQGFVDAIRKCGELLSKHLPSQPRDKNELANELRILD